MILKSASLYVIFLGRIRILQILWSIALKLQIGKDDDKKESKYFISKIYLLSFNWVPILLFWKSVVWKFDISPPLKLEKIWFFGVKSWFFTRNTPKIFAPPSARRNFLECVYFCLDKMFILYLWQLI
jgi:hypothetical protein